MPTFADTTGDPRLKYDPEANVLVIYRENTAFVAFDSESAGARLLRHPDVRALDEEEARDFEESLPVSLPPPQPHARRVGLGDVISYVAGKARIQECGGCRARRTWLNRIPVWGWWSGKGSDL
jgi:hypothetical protein